VMAGAAASQRTAAVPAKAPGPTSFFLSPEKNNAKLSLSISASRKLRASSLRFQVLLLLLYYYQA